MSERVIIKLGGSLLSPHDTSSEMINAGNIPFDFAYARQFLQLIKDTNKSYVVIIGGGFLNRWYLAKLQSEVGAAENLLVKNDFHHIGIASGIINCLIFHTLALQILGESAVYSEVIKYTDYDALQDQKQGMSGTKLVVASGRKPGHSHDVDAIYFASLFGTNQVLSFKNIDGIYSADPKKVSDAVKKKVLTWQEYKAIIHESVHEPGASFPVDAVAAQLAEKLSIGFTVLDGHDFSAVQEAIETRLCSKGSVISPE